MDDILTINRGSSSLKFAVYRCQADKSLELRLSGNIDRIGQPNTLLTAHDPGRVEPLKEEVETAATDDLAEYLISWLRRQLGTSELCAIGHRVVHGGPRYSEPTRVTPELVNELQRISPFDPDHLPAEIELIEALARWFPQLLQVACFDTAFHRQMPRVARILPIPRRLEKLGVERYGFHGLSYAYLIAELARRAGRELAEGRVVLAHLGAGASLAAVKDGHSIDTSMAFTPTAGIPMATRSGDLDPGLVAFMARAEQMTPEGFHEMVNHHSGLLGVSETTGDMRELLDMEATDARAAEAVALFCYQTKKWIGAFTAALGGLDALVFSGGIGEHAPEIRRRICAGLECLGIAIDKAGNEANRDIISTDSSRVPVYVIPTDEERMIAQSTAALVAAG